MMVSNLAAIAEKASITIVRFGRLNACAAPRTRRVGSIPEAKSAFDPVVKCFFGVRSELGHLLRVPMSTTSPAKLACEIEAPIHGPVSRRKQA